MRESFWDWGHVTRGEYLLRASRLEVERRGTMQGIILERMLSLPSVAMPDWRPAATAARLAALDAESESD